MPDIVQSVDRTLSILEILADYEVGLGLMEISEKIDLHKSTVHRLLATLIYKGYVEQDPRTSKYKITFKLFELGNKKVSKIDVVSVAKPYLQELMVKANEVVHLVVREGKEIIYVDKVESDNTIRMHSSIGKRSPLYCTSVGKAILAQLEIEEVKKIWNDTEIKQYTEYTITSWDQMQKELVDIRQKGYAIDEQENELGVRCVAAPIRNYKTEVCAAISISGPTVRMTKEKTKDFAQLVIEYGKKISRELGYRG